MSRIVLCALVVSGCAARVPGRFSPGGATLLTVNGEHVVTQEMVDAVTRLSAPGEIAELERSETARAALLDRIALGEWLYQEAVREGLHEDPAVRVGLLMEERDALARELLARRVDARVTDAAIQRLYDERAVQYGRPQAHARHILVETVDRADEVLERLARGEGFADLARELTIDVRTRDGGGDLGWFTREHLIDEVSSVAFEAPIGEVQGPIRTRFGFHVLEVLERRDAVPLDEVRAELAAQVRRSELDAVLTEIRGSLRIEHADRASTDALPDPRRSRARGTAP